MCQKYLKKKYRMETKGGKVDSKINEPTIIASIGDLPVFEAWVDKKNSVGKWEKGYLMIKDLEMCMMLDFVTHLFLDFKFLVVKIDAFSKSKEVNLIVEGTTKHFEFSFQEQSKRNDFTRTLYLHINFNEAKKNQSDPNFFKVPKWWKGHQISEKNFRNVCWNGDIL